MKNTSLIRMTIDELAEIKNISLDEAFDMFYRSRVCEMLSNKETGLFTYTAYDLAMMICG